MQINWFEIVAQIINFFVLLFILQKLLYKPVVKVMQERQERIQESQIEADEQMNKANELINQYDSKIVDIDSEKREILDNARTKAQERKTILLEEYREEAENKREAYLREIEDEKENFIANLRRNLGESAVKIASYVLNTISSRELEDEVFKNFINILQNLDDNIPDSISLEGEDSIDIHTSRDLSREEKNTIEGTLKEKLKAVKSVNYEIDESLVLGYELDFETYTLHTNIKNYLDTIEKDIIENLETN